jgi:hypothetical protein
MVRSALLIFNQGVEVPTRRLFRVLQPYFMPERLAPRNPHLQLLIIGGGAGLLISSWGWIIDGGTAPTIINYRRWGGFINIVLGMDN